MSQVSVTSRMMSLTDTGNVTEANSVDENNELNLGTVEFMVPAGCLA